MRLTEQEKRRLDNMKLAEEAQRREDRRAMDVAGCAFMIAGAVFIALAIWGIDTIAAAQWPSL